MNGGQQQNVSVDKATGIAQHNGNGAAEVDSNQTAKGSCFQAKTLILLPNKRLRAERERGSKKGKHISNFIVNF
jgi:hypothetical protein